MELFSIHCPTCNARLKVRDLAAIGQILNCPKCGSMVQVKAPADWQPPKPGQAAAPVTQPPGQTPSAPSLVDSTTIRVPPDSPAASRRRWENEVQPGEKVADQVPASASSGGWRMDSSSGGFSSPDVSSSGSVAETAPAQAAATPHGASALVAKLATYFSASWVKWMLLAGVPIFAVAVATGVWISRRTPTPNDLLAEVAELNSPVAPTEGPDEPAPQAASLEREPEPIRLSRRWLPTNSQAIVSFRPQVVLTQPAANVLLDRTTALWQPTIAKVFSALGLDVQSLERVTWSSTAAASLTEQDWLTSAVIAIELAPAAGADVRAVRASEPLDWKLVETPVRQLKSRAWPHPFAVLDERLIITGPEEQLRELSVREEHRLANDALEQLIDSIEAQQAAVVAVDLRALRDADRLPVWLPLVDLLHADAEDWKFLRAMPLALGLALGLDEKIGLELDLVCDGESGAEQVQEALDRILKAVESTIGGEAEGLTGKLLAGQINTASASELKQFLAGSQMALSGRASGIRDSMVWTRLKWQGNLPKLAAGFLASVPQLENSRLAAARTLDEEHHHVLFVGLEGYVKAEGALPAAAVGAGLLPPDTRLSWQASMLPYFGHLDWHSDLNFARAWNDPVNQRTTRRELDVMINPALGPSKITGGFPVTHYVGVAGLGNDAGQLDADDPRAGAFGFKPRYAPAQIPDGASNTILLAGVSQKLGPWARGGNATVRGFTQRPYINGPDGFGSGQPDGMLVSMADGSVRFLPKDIDPAVLERLVTVGGGESPPAPLTAANKPVAENLPEKMPFEEPAAEEAPAKLEPTRRQLKDELAGHLADRIPSIELKTTTLSELVDLVSQLSTIPITLDANGLAAVGIEPDTKVSLKMTDATIGDILSEALKPLGLQYIEAGDQLIVTDARQAAEKLESANLSIRDLVAPESDERSLARLIETFVAPTGWQGAGGAGSITVSKGALAVEQSPAIASEVADFLDKLRMARALPIARPEGRRLSLATRWSRARDKLATPVTANFSEPTPLTEIATYLQKAAGIEIAFDGLSLAAADVSPSVRTKFTADKQPLGDALSHVLERLELGFRLVNGQRLEITSAHDVEEELQLEFYPVKALLSADEDADDFTARLRKQISPTTWRENGGPAVVALDSVSSYLIVLAPQGVQIELEQWLDNQSAK